mmetsp:Transcript_713/g.1316  ORF Transcript_713/g.1316 Transcript_713/m.1316 type:complete len:86 (-) Transcript_713:242-499(-)
MQQKGNIELEKTSQKLNGFEGDDYQQQYDPNQDFAVFGVGSGATGGIQNLQEKINLGDNVIQSSEGKESTGKKSTDKSSNQFSSS